MEWDISLALLWNYNSDTQEQWLLSRAQYSYSSVRMYVTIFRVDNIWFDMSCSPIGATLIWLHYLLWVLWNVVTKNVGSVHYMILNLVSLNQNQYNRWNRLCRVSVSTSQRSKEGSLVLKKTLCSLAMVTTRHRRLIKRTRQLINQLYKKLGWWLHLIGCTLAFDPLNYANFVFWRDLLPGNGIWKGELFYEIKRVLDFRRIQVSIGSDQMIINLSMFQKQCQHLVEVNGPHQVHLFMAPMSVLKNFL